LPEGEQSRRFRREEKGKIQQRGEKKLGKVKKTDMGQLRATGGTETKLEISDTRGGGPTKKNKRGVRTLKKK